MALSWRMRRSLALLILVVGLPVYIIVAVNIVALFDRPGVLVELAVYLILGIAWALPFRFVFRGVGQPDPNAVPPPQDGRGGPGGDSSSGSRRADRS